MKELVSIIMPSYNTARYIAKSIESVKKQTYDNWELIIVDDCSNDNTDEVVERFLDDKRIRYLKNEKNSGAAISRNYALREAKGKWIAFLDSDDIWNKEKLDKQIKFMNDNKIDFSYTKYSEIDENDKMLGREISGPKRITERGMYAYCWVGCLTVMYNKEKVGVLQIKDIKKNNDYAMWLKVIKKTDCYLLDENLSFYRKRNGSISRQSYIKLVRWHYKLFRYVDEQSIMISIYYTLKNMLYGVYKKIVYVKSAVV